ncbi:hypothetical protein [Myceligenerans xiligouense]|uniref:Uncharacterized protein n=1 Tax=Myceligenerans xiligouense TaxID=253184 RepID=A0A3N4YJ16_9MICO|nr:hypothetical protein [Myceligenerans xiligouense]RPF21129.1 hypothetical protein EDD34_1748 [Myceligenerans xiligouense]
MTTLSDGGRGGAERTGHDRLGARSGLARHGMVTPGMYADKAVARRVDERLGFRLIHEVETWRRQG